VKHTLLALLMFSTPLMACPKAVDFNELLCMADNLHHEARVDGMRGMEAVATVVMNRVSDSRWPDNVCEVVYQPSQFSWTLEKRLVNMKVDHDWQTLAVARMALQGGLIDKTDESTHYHAVYVHPYWAKVYEFTVQVEQHLFYKRP
jgi:spore germination cell wall hydrolase CwlJ-like protein